jgi:single-stranded-DNA-specific exonuclease
MTFIIEEMTQLVEPAAPVAGSKLWRLLPHDRDAVGRLAESLATSPLIAQLLLNRGVHVAEDARRFLDAPLKGLHPPDLLPGVPEAADRILKAVETGRKICVYGDYDVDGVTGSAILLGTLRLLGVQADLHVPHRLEEGYGLNVEALRQIAANGGSLVVTVDCGIASLVEAREARALGLELIVTDHHEMRNSLPEAAVLVHPRLPGTSYPFGHLCGSAVALKLAWALAMRKCGGEKVSPPFREMLLDAVAMAALGVVADVVPLLDENRMLVRYGLHRLRESPHEGFKALCAAAKLDPAKPYRASDIGFKLAPRLNAAGRMGQARLAVELLTATNRQRAVDLVRVLEDLNGKRQALEKRTVEQAHEQIAAEGQGNDPALVVASSHWHGGVVGIVASRLADHYSRPALVLTLPKENGAAAIASGSGRSIPGLALHEALRACDDLLLSHGGHPAAAGFKLLPENLPVFRERFCAFVAAQFPEGLPTPSRLLDAEASLAMLTPGLVYDLDRLEPYGPDNRQPLFLAGGLQVLGEPRCIGLDQKHVQFRVSQGNTTMRAVAWRMSERKEELMSAGGACCLAFRPHINDWQGRRTVELEVIDFQAGATARLG